VSPFFFVVVVIVVYICFATKMNKDSEKEFYVDFKIMLFRRRKA
jgi:hypothetical protein